MQRSDSIGALAGALAKAQAAIKAASKDAENPHFKSKYADLAAVMDACRAQLAGNGLAVMQGVEADEARVSVTTTLAHASGEWVASTLTLRARDASPQSVGSAITYGRRFSLASLVGVVPDEDDDANEAQPRRDAPSQGRETRPQPQPAPVTRPQTQAGDARLISDAQRKRFFAISKGKGWSDDDIKKLLGQYGHTSSKDIRVSDYDGLVKVMETGVVDDAPDEDTSPIPFDDYGEGAH